MQARGGRSALPAGAAGYREEVMAKFLNVYGDHADRLLGPDAKVGDVIESGGRRITVVATSTRGVGFWTQVTLRCEADPPFELADVRPTPFLDQV